MLIWSVFCRDSFSYTNLKKNIAQVVLGVCVSMSVFIFAYEFCVEYERIHKLNNRAGGESFSRYKKTSERRKKTRLKKYSAEINYELNHASSFSAAHTSSPVLSQPWKLIFSSSDARFCLSTDRKWENYCGARWLVTATIANILRLARLCFYAVLHQWLASLSIWPWKRPMLPLYTTTRSRNLV